MSDTPRTDAAVFQVFDSDLWIDVIDAAEAKALERENAELKKQNDQLKDLLFTALKVDEKQLIGHECYAKHVLLSIKDRYERFLTKGVKRYER